MFKNNNNVVKKFAHIYFYMHVDNLIIQELNLGIKHISLIYAATTNSYKIHLKYMYICRNFTMGISYMTNITTLYMSCK